jgi:hypothetical protein
VVEFKTKWVVEFRTKWINLVSDYIKDLYAMLLPEETDSSEGRNKQPKSREGVTGEKD